MRSLANMKSFILWFINELPGFLMAEPFCYLVGFFFAFITVALIKRIINIS